jgi:hypothetical protein
MQYCKTCRLPVQTETGRLPCYWVVNMMNSMKLIWRHRFTHLVTRLVVAWRDFQGAWRCGGGAFLRLALRQQNSAHLILAFCFCAGLAGCATTRGDVSTQRVDARSTNQQHGADIYRGKYSFVRIEPAESGAAGNQPSPVDSVWLYNALAELRGKGKSLGGKPLLTTKELEELVPPLVKALGLASSGNDIVFAITGTHGVTGLFQSESVTTGRAFISSGKLNMIFGLAQVNFEDELLGNHTLRPFTPGSRMRVINTDTALEGSHWREGAPGREDWQVIALEPSAPPTSKNDARIRPTDARPARPATTPESAIEQRLEILERLKQRGLVTDQEYREKHRAILKEL